MPRPRDPRELPDEYTTHLPENHPARDVQQMTPQQQMIFPALMWFFDTQRNRGQGRTYLAARVCLELAMRGQEVFVEDVSRTLCIRDHYEEKRRFERILFNVMDRDFPSEYFRYEPQPRRLTYCGRRPR